MKLKRCQGQGKCCYPTARSAIRVAIKRSGRGGTPLRYYYHHECGSYHITKTQRMAAA